MRGRPSGGSPTAGAAERAVSLDLDDMLEASSPSQGARDRRIREFDAKNQGRGDARQPGWLGSSGLNTSAQMQTQRGRGGGAGARRDVSPGGREDAGADALEYSADGRVMRPYRSQTFVMPRPSRGRRHREDGQLGDS